MYFFEVGEKGSKEKTICKCACEMVFKKGVVLLRGEVRNKF
jgi:hypothetical protein